MLIVLLGTAAATHPIDFAGNGIATTTAFGSPAVSARVAPNALATTSAFGSAALRANLAATGISTSTALGSAAVRAQVASVGISTSTAFGSAAVSADITVNSVSSTTALGLLNLSANIAPNGVSSSTAFGDATLDSGPPPAPQPSASSRRQGGVALYPSWRPREPEPEKRKTPEPVPPHAISALGIATHTEFGWANIRPLPVVVKALPTIRLRPIIEEHFAEAEVQDVLELLAVVDAVEKYTSHRAGLR